MEEITLHKYRCGEPETSARQALSQWLWETESDRSYLSMMRYRVAGKAADVCTDTATASATSFTRTIAGLLSKPA